MKKAPEVMHCSRCGDTIPLEEQALLQGSECAFCAEIRLEAEEIRADRRSHPGQPALALLLANVLRPQSPHPQS